MTERRRWRREAVAVSRPTEEEGSEDVEGETDGGVFTRFVRALEPGEEPAPEFFAAAWNELRQLLRRELRRRRLSQGSPLWLGIYGHRGWWDETGHGGPFDELCHEAYGYVFVIHVIFLKEQVSAGRDIEALVTSCVQQFLHKRQATHDRLGSRLFEVLRSAARRAVATGELAVVSGSERVTASTVLALAGLERHAALAEVDTLAEAARRWNDELLPDLVTAVRADRRRLVDELARRFGALDRLGVEAFRFGAFLAPLQADVRARWAALATPEEPDESDESGRGVRELVRRFDSFEDRVAALDWVEKMIDCAERLVEASSESEKTKGFQRRWLGFLRVYLGCARVPGENPDDIADEVPSGRGLEKLLQIPRERLSRLFGQVRTYFERCREELAGRTAKGPEVTK